MSEMSNSPHCLQHRESKAKGSRIHMLVLEGRGCIFLCYEVRNNCHSPGPKKIPLSTINHPNCKLYLHSAYWTHSLLDEMLWILGQSIVWKGAGDKLKLNELSSIEEAQDMASLALWDLKICKPMTPVFFTQSCYQSKTQKEMMIPGNKLQSENLRRISLEVIYQSVGSYGEATGLLGTGWSKVSL